MDWFKIEQLEREVKELKAEIAELKKDSHPPIPIADVVTDVLKHFQLIPTHSKAPNV